jgi:rod shape-determining protein MreD
VSTRLRLPLVLLVLFLLQITLFQHLRIAGVQAELMLLVAIHVGRLAGADDGALIAFFCGLLYDVVQLTPLGLWALACCLVAYGVGLLTESLHRDSGPLWWFTVMTASAAGVVSVALTGAIMGAPGLADVRFVKVAVIVALWNTLLSPAVGAVLRWAFRPSGAMRSYA